jgi:hypothetical protein
LLETKEFRLDGTLKHQNASSEVKVQCHRLETDRGMSFQEAMAEMEKAEADSREVGFFQMKNFTKGVCVRVTCIFLVVTD